MSQEREQDVSTNVSKRWITFLPDEALLLIGERELAQTELLRRGIVRLSKQIGRLNGESNDPHSNYLSLIHI